MAHFAEIDENNIVLRVIVVADENEADGTNWCNSRLGGRWIQTSYNNRIRVRYAGIGYTYDEDRDAFITPKPYPSWLLDDTTTEWVPPVSYPEDGLEYIWNEETLSWVELTTS